MKICALLLLSVSISALANDPCKWEESNPFPTKNSNETEEALLTRRRNWNDEKNQRVQECSRKRQGVQEQASLGNSVEDGERCKQVFATMKQREKEAQTPGQEEQLKIAKNSEKSYLECVHLTKLSRVVSDVEDIKVYMKKEVQKFSTDMKIKCDKPFSYTYDYEACTKALAAYNFVVNSEAFMQLQQTVRTDVKQANIAKDTTKAAKEGDLQTGVYDAEIERNKHMKSMETEKMLAYSAAVAALTRAHQMIPGDGDAIDACHRSKAKEVDSDVPISQKTCQKVVSVHRLHILANQQNKAALFEAITQFIAKGLAAGIKMRQYDTNAQKVSAIKNSFKDEEGTDMMIELCEANPQDPACIRNGNRVSGSGAFGAGDFSFGGDGANNSFNMNPEGGEFGEAGAATDLDDKNSIASLNSPFADDAKIAKGILGPAGAAQSQATGGAQGGGGGGGAGGGGGGSASLGGDLNGADKEGDKEAQIKTGKVSGAYNFGSGGYKGIARGKEEGNPFSSLFDQKGSGGGVEEDRSIASGDIDGKASGLFDKISKRYGQIQADKRVEAKNFE